MHTYKKIISFALVIATVFLLCVPAFATEHSSYSAANWWDFFVHSSYMAGHDAPDYDGIPIAWLNSALCSRLTGEVCLSSDDGWHHGTEIYDYNFKNKKGVSICTYCGERFKFSDESFNDVYDAYVSTLDSPIVRSDGGSPFTWYFDGNFPSSAYLTDIRYTLAPLSCSCTCLGSDGYWSGDFNFYSSTFSVPVAGEYDFSLPVTIHSGWSEFVYFRIVRLDDGSCDTVGNSVFLYNMAQESESRSSVLELSARSLNPLNSYRLEVRYVVMQHGSSDSGLISSFSAGDVSVSPDIFSSSYSPGTRPAALMQAVDNYNATGGSSKYYIGSANSSGQITDVYSPNIFAESTKVFTEPVTGAQYQCTDWTYIYLPSFGVGAYFLDLKDGTFICDGKSIRSVHLYYLTDKLIIVGFDETQQELSDLGFPGDSPLALNSLLAAYAEFIESYSYVIAAPEECQHEYTSEITIDPTCTEPGEMTYTCPLCGNTYTEEIPALGHDWKLVETVPAVKDEDGNVLEYAYTLYECSRCKEQYMDYDSTGPPADDGTSFWDRIKNAFLGALATLIEKILDFITKVLSAILDLVYDLLSFFFDFLTGTVISGISGFFSSFTDGSLFQFFQSEDGTGYALPEGVASVFAFFSAIFLCLPADLRYVLMFGIGLIIFLAVFKLVKS